MLLGVTVCRAQQVVDFKVRRLHQGLGATGIRLVPPDGFVLTPDQKAFADASQKGRIEGFVTEGSLEENLVNLQEILQALGRNMDHTRHYLINGVRAAGFRARESAEGKPVDRHYLILETASGCVMLIGTAPADASGLNQQIRQALLTVDYRAVGRRRR